MCCGSTAPRSRPGSRRPFARWSARKLRRRGVVVGRQRRRRFRRLRGPGRPGPGAQRVLGLLLPERDSCGDTNAKGRLRLRVRRHPLRDRGYRPVLEALGCYRRRDAAVRDLLPEYGPGWRMKIAVADNLLDQDRLNYFNLVVESPDGRQVRSACRWRCTCRSWPRPT